DSNKIISITRWGAFTKTVMDLSTKNIDLSEIGGNDEIVVSILTKKDETQVDDSNLLYKSRIVTESDKERRVYLLPVAKLLDFIKTAKEKNIKVEHVFDY